MLKLLLCISFFTKGQVHKDKTLNLTILLRCFVLLVQNNENYNFLSSNRNKHKTFGLVCFYKLPMSIWSSEYLNSRDFTYTISFRIIKYIFYENVIEGFFEKLFRLVGKGKFADKPHRQFDKHCTKSKKKILQT